MAARDFIMAELVTKADLAATGELLRSEADVLHKESQVLRGELKTVQVLLGSRIDLLESRIDKLGLQLTVRLGAMLAAAVAILAALQKLG